MEDKKYQSLQFTTEGYEPKIKLPKDYKLSNSLQNAFFQSNVKGQEISFKPDNSNLKQSEKTGNNG
jgi:hypothetical protein